MIALMDSLFISCSEKMVSPVLALSTIQCIIIKKRKVFLSYHIFLLYHVLQVTLQCLNVIIIKKSCKPFVIFWLLELVVLYTCNVKATTNDIFLFTLYHSYYYLLTSCRYHKKQANQRWVLLQLESQCVWMATIQGS